MEEEEDIVCVTDEEAKDEGLPYLTEGFPACCPSTRHCMEDI